MAYKTFWIVVGSFMPIITIQKLVLFLAGNEWFHGLLIVDWEICDMLWCSKYCATIKVTMPLCGKLILTFNVLSLMKGLSERSIFNTIRVEVFLAKISSEPGDHPLPNLLLC